MENTHVSTGDSTLLHTYMFDPTTGTGDIFDVIFAEALATEREVYEADPLGGSPSRY